MDNIFKNLMRKYPIPLYTFVGLVIGIALFFSGQKQIAHYIWFATLILGGAPIVYETVKGMFKGQFASDIIAMLAIITAIFMDQAFAGAIVVLMQSGGEALEKYGLGRASSSLKALLERAPRIAQRKTDGTVEEISVNEVRVGDILVVRSGDLIPVDGTIVEGEAEIDESAMTGEPLAHRKKVGAAVLSGTIDTEGVFEMRADKSSSESQYAKIVELVRTAQMEKAPIQRLADRYAIIFTPLTILMSLLGWLITQDATTILSVLVVATPCPLILATPVAVLSGINRAAQGGIIVKGGVALEQIGKVKAALFDKTGTITYGTPSVERIIHLNAVSEQELLFKAAALEQLSSHSTAQAILSYAEKVQSSFPFPKNFQEIPGRGVEGDVNGQHVLLGSEAFLEERLNSSILTEEQRKIVDQIREEGKLVANIAIDGKMAGIIVLSDQMRKEVPSMVERLRALHIEEIVIVTGDSPKNTQVVAEKAGIAHFFAHLLPPQKVEAVRTLQEKYKKVMMVGDGINDAPALAAATVGVAMGARGTAISAEAADVVILVDDVEKVAEAVFIGQRMLRIATEGILIGMGLSFILMCFAVFGFIVPAMGALLQEIIDFIVVMNALRAR